MLCVCPCVCVCGQGGKSIAVKVERRRDSLDGAPVTAGVASSADSSEESEPDSGTDDDSEGETDAHMATRTKSPGWGGASIASRGTKKSGGISAPRSPSKQVCVCLCVAVCVAVCVRRACVLCACVYVCVLPCVCVYFGFITSAALQLPPCLVVF